MSTDKITIQRAFNIHFIELLNDITSCYPDNVDILTSKVTFENLKKMNPSLIIKAWFTYVYAPYKTQIDVGDLAFFFDKDYSSDLNEMVNNDEVLRMIEKVRGPLRNMDEKNREHTSNYLRNLSKLSVVYAGMSA